jgi:hypothetical protein
VGAINGVNQRVFSYLSHSSPIGDGAEGRIKRAGRCFSPPLAGGLLSRPSELTR